MVESSKQQTSQDVQTLQMLNKAFDAAISAALKTVSGDIGTKDSFRLQLESLRSSFLVSTLEILSATNYMAKEAYSLGKNRISDSIAIHDIFSSYGKAIDTFCNSLETSLPSLRVSPFSYSGNVGLYVNNSKKYYPPSRDITPYICE